MTTRSLRKLAISLAAPALLAGPAWSARVAQVRVGEHPTFTRVVFELDARAGYAIERREVEGGQELVVTLSASSVPRKLGSRSPMVTAVEVEPSGADAVARVRLRRSAPLVKELILSSPPRIVLDLMHPEELVRAAPKPRSAPTTAAAPKPVEEPAPEAKPAPETRPLAKVPPPAEPPKPKPMETAAAPKALQKDEPKRIEAPPEKVEPKRVEAPPEKVEPKRVEAPAASAPVAAPPAAKPGSELVEAALEAERIVEPKPAEPAAPREVETADAIPPAPGAPSAPKQPELAPPTPLAKTPLEPAPPKPLAKAPAAPVPTPARPERSSGPFGLTLRGSDPWLTMALVGAGALLFLIVVAVLLRRHSRPTSLDALELARGDGETLGGEDAFVRGSDAAGSRDAFSTSGPGLFDEEHEKGDMEMAAQLPMEREARGRMAQTPIGADPDLGPLVRELERRMAQLESRLDQANEARERLERQVTAQSEELRVQRAAIARTQRALRGMNRGGEEQATEPALRDPAKPTSARS